MEPEGATAILKQLDESTVVKVLSFMKDEQVATLLGSLFEGNHADEVFAFLAPVLIGSLGRPAADWPGFETMAEALRLRDVTVEPLPPDVLVRGYTGSWEPR